MKKSAIALISVLLGLSIVFTSGCQLVAKIGQGPATLTPTTEAPTDTALPPAISTTSTPAIGGQLPTTAAPAAALPGVADVIAKVKPSVVAINVTAIGQSFFGQYKQTGAGSGWIISQDGLIVTNNHVIAGARTINVTLADGRDFLIDPATVATDDVTDLAVLKVDATGLPALQVGDPGPMRVGDWVVVIGNALGQGIRATAGIISNKNVTLQVDQNTQVSGLIETDAAINAGNSGGPLVNLAGQVIGIASIKIASSGVEGMGYAISMDQALPVIRELITNGSVTYPYLGVQMISVDTSVQSYYRLAVSKGVLLSYVDPTSPASKAGLQAGDVVVKFNDKQADTSAALLDAIHQAKVGQQVTLVVYRGNNQMTVAATLAQRPRQ